MEKLKGGRTIGVSPDRPQVSLYADPARIRVGAPGTMVGNVALGAVLNDCAKTRNGVPEPVWAKVLFREAGNKLYLLLAPEKEQGPDIYELKWEGRSRTPVIRGLKLLFEAAQITLQPDLWYDLEPRLVEAEGRRSADRRCGPALGSPRQRQGITQATKTGAGGNAPGAFS